MQFFLFVLKYCACSRPSRVAVTSLITSPAVVRSTSFFILVSLAESVKT